MQLYLNAHPEAFSLLYKRHSGRLYAFLAKRVANSIAEELLQEVFLKLHTQKHTYKLEYPFLPWLFTITHNTLKDHFKKSATKVSTKSQEFVESDFTTEHLTESESSTASLLDHLAPDQKHIFELRYLQDWSFEQIARETRKTPANIRKMISRGLKKLQNQGFKKDAL